MDDPVTMTPTGYDTVSEETDDYTHTEQHLKDDGVVLAQLALEGPVAPWVPSAEDPHTKDVKNPSA